MAAQFENQGGAANMDPSALRRWLLSKYLSFRFSDGQRTKRRRRAEKRRRAESRPHVVEYFHQIDDAYSHLAAQLLARLAARYDIELRCHLVRGPEGHNVSDAQLLLQLARYDSSLIAPQYGLSFPSSLEAPAETSTALALSILTSLESESLSRHLAAVSEALWHGDSPRLQQYADELSRASAPQVAERLAAGTERRAALKHYSGAMFHYEGEWYWGVDRLHYLEARLAALGADTRPGEPPLAPCPSVDLGGVSDTASLTLEFYPSLRSPYTAIVFDETVALASQAGVRFRVRPVLPMVMRGVPVTFEKGMYIFFDVAREAKRRRVPYGNLYDPIGDPVRRCYSLYPWATEQGLGTALLSSFLHHAFAEGVNTNTSKGLRKVVEGAGLRWSEAQPRVGKGDWEQALEDNRLAMYQGGLWGVPSYRLLAPSGEALLQVWGQDRLWLVAREIQRYHASRDT
ncbi:MAG: DsbA family protein [Pseudomonadota bacterium]